jgi:fused signal recognition particle receptor
MLGKLGKLFSGLSKTRTALVTGMRKLLGRGTLDEATLDAIEELLYTADLGPTARRLVDDIRAAFRRGELKTGEDVEPFVRARILDIMGSGVEGTEVAPEPDRSAHKPHVILVVGVNGSGKTTSIAKLTALFKDEGRSVMLAACDTYRAAAVEQLTIWSERLDVPIIKRESGANPSGLAFDAAEAAVHQDIDVLLVDTAGRLHTQDTLMAELEKIRRVIGKRIDGAPHEVLLILDGTTGQNAIVQAQAFKQVVDVTGVMVTKLDGTAKGGAVVSITDQLGLPIRFIGLGEQATDIERFDPEAFVAALFAAE